MNVRSLVTLTLALLALTVAFSGIILYLAPPGSLPFVKVLGLKKEEWELIHTVTSFALVIVASIHVWLNRRALTVYVKRSKSELWISLGIVAFLVASSILYVPPASLVDSVKEGIENWWTSQYRGVKGYGQYTLAEFCKEHNISLSEAVRYIVEKYGVKVDPEESLRDIAAKAGTSPALLAEELLSLTQRVQTLGGTASETATQVQQTQQVPQPQGQGYGLLTLQQFCEQNGIPLEKAIDYLKEKYGVEVSANETIRDIAFKVGSRPYALVEELINLK